MSGVYKMGGKETSEKDEKEFASFSVRLPTQLAQQIDARCAISKRSRNMEITLLLERQIEAEVERDRKLIEKMAFINAAPQNSQS